MDQPLADNRRPPSADLEQNPQPTARAAVNSRSGPLDTTGWALVAVIIGLAFIVMSILPSLRQGQTIGLMALDVGEREVAAIFGMVVVCLGVIVLMQTLTDDLTDGNLD